VNTPVSRPRLMAVLNCHVSITITKGGG
jgi:hypothetical protein